jgi:hypothetical protein
MSLMPKAAPRRLSRPRGRSVTVLYGLGARNGAPEMSTHVEDLQTLRALSVEQRRKLVRDLASPGERGGAQDVRDLFLKLQATIEVIDRALVDEQASTSVT